MEQYINTLLEQIRYKKARAAVEEEIRSHIEDQTEAYRADGMEEAEAVKAAVKDMGDPVAAGVELDRIHRPHMEWGILIIIGIISVLSIVVQIAIGQADADLGRRHIEYHIEHVLFGILLMLAMYRMDYSFIGKYARYIALAFSAFMVYGIFLGGLRWNGARAYVRIPGLEIIVSLISLVYLFIPVYAGLLYQYRGSGYSGIVKSILWLLFIPWLCRNIPTASTALNMFFMMALLFSFAVWKNWFRVKRVPFLIAFWGVVLVLPTGVLIWGVSFKRLAEYQIARLQGMFSLQPNDYNFVAVRVREYMGNSLFIGNSGSPFAGYLPSYESEQLFTFLASYYGLAAAFAAFAVIIYIAGRIFRIALRQKNQLGMMIGCGCGLVFLVQTLIHILVNFGVTSMPTLLPFFSSGGTGIAVSYILLGVVLSICRYKDILSERPKKIVSEKEIKLPKFSIIIKRNDGNMADGKAVK